MMDTLQEILKEIHPGIDYQNETALIDDGLLDSFNVIAIVTELNNRFGIRISISDLEPENFNSMQAIHALVERHRQKQSR
jgi:D-alanine--poly(phosphoribitol) ligase subunit 2